MKLTKNIIDKLFNKSKPLTIFDAGLLQIPYPPIDGWRILIEGVVVSDYTYKLLSFPSHYSMKQHPPKAGTVDIDIADQWLKFNSISE